MIIESKGVKIEMDKMELMHFQLTTAEQLRNFIEILNNKDKYVGFKKKEDDE